MTSAVGTTGANGSFRTDGWPAAAQGGAGGPGGSGGSGGIGGTGGAGGTGSTGASGGGSIILGARGLLQFVNLSTPISLNVSAGTPGTGGAGGGGGTALGGGAGAVGGTTSTSGGIGGRGPNPGDPPAGNGGGSRSGGDGKAGGTGGVGGTGGAGGNAGHGTPGMLKLVGSVIQASTATVAANNAGSTQPNHNGSITLLTNMGPAAVTAHAPQRDTSSGSLPVLGRVRGADYSYRPDWFIATTNAPFQTSGTAYPLLPDLQGGFAAHGWCLPDYWNEPYVDASTPASGKVEFVVFRSTTGFPTVFDGYDQVVIKNQGATTAYPVILKLGTNPAILIEGAGGTAGQLPAGRSWTTTVTAGTPVDAGIGIAITVQPVSQTVNPGTAATFSVTAVGSSPKYQWRKGTTNITGATNASYSIASAQESDEGSYVCVVSNIYKTEVSLPAGLSVNNPVAIVSQPTSRTLPIYGTLNVSVTATGSPPLSYQWRKNGVNISGATQASYSKVSVTGVDNGGYDCVVRNAVNTVTSNVATITVLDPAITDQPDNQVVLDGYTATFSLSAVGSGTISYTWYRDEVVLVDGGRISGADTATLSISNVSSADEGMFKCYVLSAGGGIWSDEVALLVSDPAILIQPTGGTVDPGGAFSFTCIGLGSEPLSYQWMHDGAPLDGQTTSNLTIDYCTYGEEGAYTCSVSNFQGTVVSNPADLDVNGNPIEFIAQPQSLKRYTGESATFDVGGVLGGFGVPVYHWKFDDGQKAIVDVGTDSSELTLPGLTLDQAGEYFCEVTDDSPFTYTSAHATLEVGLALGITGQPAGAEKIIGEAHTFTVEVTGGVGTVLYQWMKDGIDIPGETTPSLALTDLVLEDSGSYTVMVSDEHLGIEESAPAVLIVTYGVPVTVPAGLALLAGIAVVLGTRRLRKRS